MVSIFLLAIPLLLLYLLSVGVSYMFRAQAKLSDPAAEPPAARSKRSAPRTARAQRKAPDGHHRERSARLGRARNRAALDPQRQGRRLHRLLHREPHLVHRLGAACSTRSIFRLSIGRRSATCSSWSPTARPSSTTNIATWHSITEYLDAIAVSAFASSTIRPDGRYRVFKEIITDPHQPSCSCDARLEGDAGAAAPPAPLRPARAASERRRMGQHAPTSRGSPAHEFLTAQQERCLAGSGSQTCRSSALLRLRRQYRRMAGPQSQFQARLAVRRGPRRQRRADRRNRSARGLPLHAWPRLSATTCIAR